MNFIVGAILVVTLTPILAFAHGGKVDNNGGHTDKESGKYHCHHGPCVIRNEPMKKSIQEAVDENRPMSLVYERKAWKHWSDFDDDCMNTRHEILKDQSKKKVKLSANGCNVVEGKWLDPFSGDIYTKSSDLDVDHIIPLKWANDHGGSRWTKKNKEQFANDPVNLLAVDDNLNQAKGARGPDEWMPPNQSFRCEYLKIWSTVLQKYELKMTTKEKRVFKRQLKSCG